MFGLLLVLLLAFWTKPYWEEPVREAIPEQVFETFHSIQVSTTQAIEDNNFDFDTIKDQASSLYSSIVDSDSSKDSTLETEQEYTEQPELTRPEEQSFSIGNIELGDTKEDVEGTYGEPRRESENEYGVNWSTYHENYHNFMMVAYDKQGIVRGLFTNQDLLSSQHEIALGDSQDTVNETLGNPEEVIQNGRFRYRITSDGEYDVYQLDGNNVTFFYDIHEGNEVTAVQLIDDELEATREALYTPGNEALKAGFEQQLFDLTNATRVNHELPVLEWNEEVSETARNHSTDMAKNQYFGHTNRQGQSPFDRMEEDNISFTTAGENLAYGQFSSIFAHQGLMNSEGHRENILQNNFAELGVGVDFNSNNQPFYTEKFLTNQWR